MSVTVNQPPGGAPRALVSIAPDYGTMGWCLAILRIFLGVQLLMAGIGKWGWLAHSRLPYILNTWLYTEPRAPISWYVPFVVNSVLRHVNTFTWLVVFGEIILGTLLIFGLFTRLAAFFALIMLLNYLFVTWNLGLQWQGLNEALIAIAFTCMATGAGRIFGIDVSNAIGNPRSVWW